MDPIVTVLRFGGLERPIGAYGCMMALALVVGSAITVRAAARARIDVGATIAALGFAVAGGFLGAWVLYLVVEWARTGAPLQALARPGLVFFGAPLGGLAAGAFACRRFGVPLGRLVDVAVPALPAAHAMGRIGCFLGGCCYGAPWQGPWAVRYLHPLAPAAHPPVWRHPTPLYEAGALLVLAFVFALVPMRSVGQGIRLLTYAIGYCLVRIGMEALRGDLVRGVWLDGALSTSQLVAVLLLLGAIAGLAWARTTGRGLVSGPSAR
jgi:phosphatidylglycerol:prolipoprotein diacylglycerol transferase